MECEGNGNSQDASSRVGPRGRFWNDLYWFAVIAIGAWIVGVLILPHKAAETVELLRKERETRVRLESLERQEKVLLSATEAIQNDPIYREGVIRNLLGLKRISEEFLVPPPPSFPITPGGSR